MPVQRLLSWLLGRGADSTSSNRRTVIRIYLGLRVLFVLASLTLLSSMEVGLLDQPSASPEERLDLWAAFGIFVVWSAVLIGVGWYALQKERLKLADRTILASLLPDGFTIYLAAEATGAAASPFYHSVYFLIAIHSYHLAVPEKAALSPGIAALARRYFILGAAPSVVIAYSVYLSLSNTTLRNLGSWVELGLQLVTAFSFAWLGLKDTERSKDLAGKEGQLQEAEKRLAETKEHEDRLLQSLGRVTNVAEMCDEGSLVSGLENLAEQIGRTLKATYCAVGLVDDGAIEDTAVWTSFELSQDASELLSKVKRNQLESSFIGRVLTERREPISWDSTLDGDPLDPGNPRLLRENLPINAEAAASYRRILPGAEVRHMLVVPFYAPQDPRRPVGYFHVINRESAPTGAFQTGFSAAHAESLKAIGGQLAIAIENFRSRQREQEERADEVFLEKMAVADKGVDVFGELLSRLNEAFDSRVASLWLPIEDGFGPAEEVRKLVLRTARVSGPEVEPGANQRLEEKLRLQGLHSHRSSYIGRYLDDSPSHDQPHYQPDISNYQHCWSDLLVEIGTPRLLVVPIQDPLATLGEKSSPAERILAVLCLRPRQAEFQLTEFINKRLLRFSRQIENLILEKRLRRRFEQIRLLKKGLEGLQSDDLRTFYSRVVAIVKEVMAAEACSLFLLGRSPTQLLLKASTAKHALAREEDGTDTEVEITELLDKPIFTIHDGGLTVGTFQQRKAVLVYDSYRSPILNRKFLEVTSERSLRSFIGAPIVGNQGAGKGVIHCINALEPNRLLPSFLRSDLEFFTLIAGVVSRLIEIAEAGAVRTQFLREIAHELATPLLQAQTNTSFIEKYLRGARRVKDPLEVVANLRDTLSHLQKLVADIQSQVAPSETDSTVYSFQALVNMHDLIELIRKPMVPVARESRAIEIRGRTDGMPPLYVDRPRMEQVFYNLLQNAVKYSRYGGLPIWIEYDLYQESSGLGGGKAWHRIRVENYGIGVPEGEEELIFREFVRGSNTQFVGSGQSGTGLGLSVARRIVESHGGELKLEKRDNPTIFAVLLPDYLQERASKR